MKAQSLLVLMIFSCFSCFRINPDERTHAITPEKYRLPENYIQERYPYSLEELKNNFSDELMKKSARVNKGVKETNSLGKWKATPESIDKHKAPEWFMDAKFGMFIDWGLWSIAGWAPKREKGPMYPDWYEFKMHTDSAYIEYHLQNWGKDFRRDDFIPLFKATEFNPDKLVKLASEAGMKYVIPFCKHHSGFCLWPSSYTKRNAFDMGPNRDLIKPLVESCKKEELKFGFYFSVDEWEYPVIDASGKIIPRIWSSDVVPSPDELEHRATGKIAVNNFAEDYLLPQAVEFIDKYDPDLLWYDGEWLTEALDLKTYDIAAYFYNQAEGRKEVAVNDRYGTKDGKRLRSVHGDFYTSEYHLMKDEHKKIVHPWEECRGISQSYGFNWQDTDNNVISSKDLIDMFINIVASGGNLLLMVNLDGQGALPEIQEKRLQDMGKWLAVNGEGIYATRPYTINSEDNVSYTQSKDGQFLFAILKKWPGDELILESVARENIREITMLGTNEKLRWEKAGEGILIKIPENLQETRPCEYAWVLKLN